VGTLPQGDSMRTEKNRFAEVVCAAALTLLGAVTAHGQGPNFNPGCALPFAQDCNNP